MTTPQTLAEFLSCLDDEEAQEAATHASELLEEQFGVLVIAGSLEESEDEQDSEEEFTPYGYLI